MHKGAIIGFGQVAEHGHAPAFAAKRESFQIAAVADGSPERLKAAGVCFPGARLYSSMNQLLKAERGLDFVDIATPPSMHPRHAAAALAAGFNVMCEKPLAFKPRDFARLEKLALDSGKCLFTVHNWKKARPIAKAKELIAGGAIGALKHLELHVLRSQAAVTAAGDNWRQNLKISGGGIMVDHGWHNFYLACHLAGQRPLRVSAALSYPQGQEKPAEDICACSIDFESATALIYLTWRSPVRKNLVLVYGEAGIIEVQGGNVILEKKGVPPQVFETGDSLSAGSAHPLWMADLLDDFKAELELPARRGGNLAEAGFCVSLLAGGYKSAKTGRFAAVARGAANVQKITGGI